MSFIGPKIVCLFAAFMFQAGFVQRLLAVQFVVVGQNVQMSEASFDKNSFGQTMLSARKKAEDSLQAHLMLIEKAAVLTKAQRRKLELAGHVDIHRFFAYYQSVKRTMRFGSMPRNEWQTKFAEMRKMVQPIVSQYKQGLHGESSLLTKALATTLDEIQNASVEQLFQEREMLRYADYIRITLARIDQRVPLTGRQRSTITTLLLSKTDPPESYGASTMPFFKVLHQMAQVEDEIHGLFSDEEGVVISRLIQAGKTAVEKE